MAGRDYLEGPGVGMSWGKLEKKENSSRRFRLLKGIKEVPGGQSSRELRAWGRACPWGGLRLTLTLASREKMHRRAFNKVGQGAKMLHEERLKLGRVRKG